MHSSAAITSEMAALQDLAGKRLADLLEARGTLIHQLVAGSFDPGDSRLAIDHRGCGPPAGKAAENAPILSDVNSQE